MTKRTKLWLPILLAVMMVVCVALAACTDPVECSNPDCTCENCTGEDCTCGEPAPHQCNDKCSECGKCTSSCTDPVCSGNRCPHGGNHPAAPFVTAPFTGVIGKWAQDEVYILFLSEEGNVYARYDSDEGDYEQDSATYTISSTGAISIKVGTDEIGTGTIVGNTLSVTMTLDGDSKPDKDFTFTGAMYKANVTIDGDSSTWYIAQGTPLYLLVYNEHDGDLVLVNGSVVAGQDLLTTTMPAQEVSIEILSTQDKQSISDYVGVWSMQGHSVTIVAQSGAYDVVGYAVLDGKSFLTIYNMEGTLIASNTDEDNVENYTFTYLGDDTIALITLDGSVYHFTQKSTVVSAPESDFMGKWMRSATQKLLVEAAGEAHYTYQGVKSVGYLIVGQYLVFNYTASNGYDYYYILVKSGSGLAGYFLAPDVTPVEVTLSANGFYTLKVDGEYVEFVNAGSKPTAISEPTAPSGKKFDGWVLVGTETPFDFDEVMTADASIEATFVDDTTPPAPTEGEYTGGSFSYSVSWTVSQTVTSFTISADHSSVTLYFSDGTTVVRSLSNETGAGYLPSHLQSATAVYEMVDGQQNSYYLCIFNNSTTSVSVYSESYVLLDTFTKAGGGDSHTCTNPECACDSCTGEDCTCGTQPSDQITISFTKAAGATGTQESVTWTKGESYTLPACTFSHEGMTFLGWKLSGQTNVRVAGAKITFNENTTLIAVFGSVYTDANGYDYSITVRDDGYVDYDGEHYTYTANESVILVDFEIYSLYYELNDSNHKYIILDGLYGMSFTTNDRQHTLTLDGKGGARLDSHDLSYTLNYSDGYEYIVGFTLTGADSEYAITIEGTPGSYYINVKITIGGQDYVFGTPADGPQLPEDADGTYKFEAGMTDLDRAMGQGNGDYAFTQAVLSGDTLTLSVGGSYPVQINLTWTGNVGTGKFERVYTLTITVTEGEMLLNINLSGTGYSATFIKDSSTSGPDNPGPDHDCNCGNTDCECTDEDCNGDDCNCGNQGGGGDNSYDLVMDYTGVTYGYATYESATGNTISFSSSNVGYKVVLNWMSSAATPYFQLSFTYYSVPLSQDNKTQTANLRPAGASSGNVTDSESAVGTYNVGHSAIDTVTFGVNAQGLRTLTFTMAAGGSVTWTEFAA